MGVTEEEVELKFTAPNKEGIYNFTVCVRSDSYLGVDLLEDIKLDVQKAWEAPKEHKQWEFTDDEEDDENKKDDSEESEYAEDSEYSEAKDSTTINRHNYCINSAFPESTLSDKN